MGNTTLLLIFFGTAILIWLAVLTFFFVRIFSHYNTLLKGVGVTNLEEILKKILKTQDLKDKDILDINNRLKLLQSDSLKHIQKVGFVRFNPFNETGGDNSFTISFLDANYDGVVVTGLHTREKTRMYAKKIEKGKSNHDLSKEEVMAIREAAKI